MAKFASGHGLYYFPPQLYISKRTIFGSKPWLFCELALDWVPDVVPSAPFSPKRAYSRKQKCIRKDPFPATKKRMIWFIHSQQVPIPANCSCSAKAPMAGGGRHPGPFRHKPMYPHSIPMFSVVLGCYSKLRSGILPQASTYCTTWLLPDPSNS